MILDIILGAVIFVWAVFGYRKGFIQQIFVFVGVLAVAFGSAPLADIAEKVISEEFDIILAGRYTKMFLLAGCSAVLFIVVTLIGRFLQETLVQGIPMAEKTNHVLGAIVGIICSVITVVFILGVCAAGHYKIEHYAPGIGQFLSKSTSYQIVLKDNPVLVFDFFKEFRIGKSSEETERVEREHTDDKSSQRVKSQRPDKLDLNKKTDGESAH